MTTPALKATLQRDLHAAMRERDEVRTSTLRMALAAITTEEVSGKAARELSDIEVMSVLTKEGKKRKESAQAFAEAGREELASRETAELAVLEAYLPEPLDEEALDAIVEQAVASTGATSMAQMGQVMQVAQAAVAGRADGARVAAKVRARLA